MKKFAVVLILIVISLAGAYLFYEKRTAAPPEQNAAVSKEEKKQNSSDQTICPAVVSQGRYAEYSEEILNKKCSGYNKTILFFYAPWCPECRGFDKAITSGEIPAGTQILKVDYDSSSELKKKYGVTIQTTFVRVDANGEKIKTWTGYGAEKSIDLILENT